MLYVACAVARVALRPSAACAVGARSFCGAVSCTRGGGTAGHAPRRVSSPASGAAGRFMRGRGRLVRDARARGAALATAARWRVVALTLGVRPPRRPWSGRACGASGVRALGARSGRAPPPHRVRRFSCPPSGVRGRARRGRPLPSAGARLVLSVDGSQSRRCRPAGSAHPPHVRTITSAMHHDLVRALTCSTRVSPGCAHRTAFIRSSPGRAPSAGDPRVLHYPPPPSAATRHPRASTHPPALPRLPHLPPPPPPRHPRPAPPTPTPPPPPSPTWR